MIGPERGTGEPLAGAQPGLPGGSPSSARTPPARPSPQRSPRPRQAPCPGDCGLGDLPPPPGAPLRQRSLSVGEPGAQGEGGPSVRPRLGSVGPGASLPGDPMMPWTAGRGVSIPHAAWRSFLALSPGRRDPPPCCWAGGWDFLTPEGPVSPPDGGAPPGTGPGPPRAGAASPRLARGRAAGRAGTPPRVPLLQQAAPPEEHLGRQHLLHLRHLPAVGQDEEGLGAALVVHAEHRAGHVPVVQVPVVPVLEHHRHLDHRVLIHVEVVGGTFGAAERGLPPAWGGGRHRVSAGPPALLPPGAAPPSLRPPPSGSSGPRLAHSPPLGLGGGLPRLIQHRLWEAPAAPSRAAPRLPRSLDRPPTRSSKRASSPWL